MKSTTDIDMLFEELRQLAYPDTMKMVQGEIPGIAFFPGGKGTYKNDNTLFDKDFMILGQDFQCEQYFNDTLKAGKEDIIGNPTWRNILPFIEAVNIKPDQCFFTNAIPGIRKGNTGTGKSPAFKDKDFLEQCRMLFQFQLKMQRPKIILALGLSVAEFLSKTANELSCWGNIKNFSEVDKEKKQVISATFDNNIKSEVVLLTHPSYRPVNVRRRSYNGFIGNRAEVELVKDTIKIVQSQMD